MIHQDYHVKEKELLAPDIDFFVWRAKRASEQEYRKEVKRMLSLRPRLRRETRH